MKPKPRRNQKKYYVHKIKCKYCGKVKKSYRANKKFCDRICSSKQRHEDNQNNYWGIKGKKYDSK